MLGRETAKKYIEWGLNPIPLKDKVPTIPDFISPMSEKDVKKYDFTDIGICTGIVSGGLEVLDFDLKGVEDKRAAMTQFQDKVGRELIRRLPIQSTKNGGYHILYRCSQIESSRILARNGEGEVLIETRGEGALIKCYPSLGYEMVRGSFEDIPIITPVERNKLFAAAFFMDQEHVVKVNRLRERKPSKFPEYDSDPSVGLDLLKKHGWVEIHRSNEWVELRRPGKNDGTSGGYNLEGCFLYLFTTSTQFKERHPYNNLDIYTLLECEGDYKLSYNRLREAGHMKEVEGDLDPLSGNFDLEQSLKTLSFISTSEEELKYIEQSAKNEIPPGLSTGWPKLDEYMLLKANSFNVGLGLDGVGKSLFMSSIATSSNTLHNWKWAMVMPENKTAVNRIRLMEAHTGQKISSLFRNPRIYQRWLKHVYDNYFIVANRKHWSIKDVILMGKRLFEYYGVNALLVDPYNFFKVAGKDGYSYNNEILSELRVFAENYCSVYMMTHPNSDSPRKSKDADGFLKAPSSYDIQGGADFPYRVDDFFVLHRIKNHPEQDIRNTMQVIVHKVKERETGGKEHPKDRYTALTWMDIDGFSGYFDEAGDNPMLNLIRQKENKPDLPFMTPDEAFK